jgi:tripartite-type tricarboxylate transporter receptor subunit TctC
MKMKEKWSKSSAVVAAGVFLFVIAGAVVDVQAAEKYPNKPVRFVITHAPGGSNDKPIRLIQPFLQKVLGVPVVLENMPGAGGNIARAYVQKQAPDGYTFLVSQQPSVSSGAIASAGVPPYDPLKFVQVFNISGKSYLCVAVPYNSPFKNVKELIEASKKSQLTMGGAGAGGTSFIVYVLLEKAGAKLQYVPFNSAPEAAMAIAGNQIDMASSNYDFFLPMRKQNKVRLLAVTGPERGEFAPDVPTLTEQGIPGIELDQIVGAHAPVGFPKDRLDIMAAAFARAMQDEGFKKVAKDAQLVLNPMGPEQFKAEFMKLHKMIEFIGPLLKEAAKQ